MLCSVPDIQTHHSIFWLMDQFNLSWVRIKSRKSKPTTKHQPILFSRRGDDGIFSITSAYQQPIGIISFPFYMVHLRDWPPVRSATELQYLVILACPLQMSMNITQKLRNELHIICCSFCYIVRQPNAKSANMHILNLGYVQFLNNGRFIDFWNNVTYLYELFIRN